MPRLQSGLQPRAVPDLRADDTEQLEGLQVCRVAAEGVQLDEVRRRRRQHEHVARGDRPTEGAAAAASRRQ